MSLRHAALVASTFFATAVGSPADDRSTAVDAVFADIDRTDSPGAVVAIVSGTEVLYQRGYGMANLEHGIPVTPRTIFDVASVSKQFGAMTAILAAGDGLIDLDDDVRAHVPELHDFDHRVTVRHLLHHTSGIRDWPHLMVLSGVDMGDLISFEKIKKMLFRQRALNFPPGSEYAYSNTGYNLLAEIVARASSKSFRQVASERIFAPLYMNDTFFEDNHEEIVPRRAASYEPAPGGGYENSFNQLTALASSSLHTSMEDFTKWMVNFETKTVGGAEGQSQLQDRYELTDGTVIDYARGLAHGTYRGLATVGHGGSWRGFRSYFVRFPEHHFSVAVFANFSDSNPTDRAQKIADAYLGEHLGPRQAAGAPEPRKPAIEMEAAALSRFAGTYYSYELDTTYELSVRDGALTAEHWRNDTVVLRPVGDDTFESDTWFFANIVFTRAADGRVDGFGLNGDRVRNLRFERRDP